MALHLVKPEKKVVQDYESIPEHMNACLYYGPYDIRQANASDLFFFTLAMILVPNKVKIQRVGGTELQRVNGQPSSKPTPSFLMSPVVMDKSTEESVAVMAEDPSEFIPVFNSIAKHNGVSGTKIRGLHLALDKKTFENPPYIQANISSGKVIGINSKDSGDLGWKKLDLMQGDFLVILGRDTGKRAGRIMLVPEGTLRTTIDHSGNIRELEAIRKELSFIDTKQFLDYV